MTREEYIRWKQQDLEEQKTHSKEIAEKAWNAIELKLKNRFIEGTYYCKSKNVTLTVHDETNTLMWKRFEFVLCFPEINLEIPCIYYGQDISFDIDKYDEVLLPYYNEEKSRFYKKIIEEAKKECVGDDWIKIPYDTTATLRKRQQEVIEQYYKMEIRNYNDGYFRNLPVYGYCYYDETGIYLAKYTATDYYKQTHKIVKGTFKNAQMKGDYAEFWIPKRIFDNYQGYCKKLWNTYIPVHTKTDDYQEADVIVLTEYGIICLECKNRITPVSFADIEGDKWYDAINNEFYSPLLQNRKHVEALKRYLADIVPENVPYINVVCFLCEYKNTAFFHEHQIIVEQYEYTHKDVIMGDNYVVEEKLNRLFQESEKVITPEELDKIYERLYEYTQFDSEKKKRIVEKIIERHGGK